LKGGKMIEKEVLFNGKIEKFGFKEFSFHEKNMIIEESTDIKIVSGQSIIKVSSSKLVELGLLRGLVKAPFEINLINIQNLNFKDAERLYQVVSEINELDEKKN
jgi:hypothetical protein